MRAYSLTTSHEQCLRDQTTSEDQPGTVLRDFGMLLNFLGQDGVEAGGKFNLLPIRAIGELDRRLSRPLNLQFKRPHWGQGQGRSLLHGRRPQRRRHRDRDDLAGARADNGAEVRLWR